MKLALWILIAFSAHTTMAATIAVIDSGTDVKHVDLINNIWMNAGEVDNNGRDEDDNGYQDDIYGWNFAESNNLVMDRKYLGTFSADPYLFFDIQGKMFMGTASAAELKWVEEKRKDPLFAKEMGKFGNFVHGTHVAGITVDGNSNGSILSVKLIPTEISPFFHGLKTQSNLFKTVSSEDSDGIRMGILKAGLALLATQQMVLLEEIAAYVAGHKADIANGSFGTGYNQSKMITDNAFKLLFQRDPTADESDKVAKFFLSTLITEGQNMVNAAPNTLFVFASGNDGMNNDIYPTSPTNIDAGNVISVAATYKHDFIAPFSNYGTKTVDVAAPGMLINSTIPGNEYLKVSGTSQAAPYVANVAAQIKDANPELLPVQIKKILMGTVDIKSYLSAKVKAQGIVNMKRATHAAKLTLATDVDSAISEAIIQISDEVQDTGMTKASSRAFAIVPIPLTPLFK